MEQTDVISLRDYLVVLRRQRWVIAVVTVIVVAVAVAISLIETPIYEAEAEVVVEPVRRTQDVSLEQLLGASNTMVETERRIILSRPVTDRVIEELGAGDPQELQEQVRVEVVRDTRVVQIIAEDPDPVAAASIANAYATAYLDYRRNQAVESLLGARANLEERADRLREDIRSLDAQIDAASEDEASSLEVQRDSLLAQLSQVVGQMAELGETVDVVSGGGDIIEPATVPSDPVSPRPLRTGALAVVLGLLLGVGLAFLRDHLDDVVRDEDDLKRSAGGRPLLGRIPTWKDPAGNDRLVTIVEPAAIPSEAYRELSAGVRFQLLTSGREPPAEGERAGRSVMLTSALAGDGKTSTAANLAVAASRVGLRTVLVDADLRRPSIAKRLGLGRTTGLSDVLLSGGRAADHVIDVGVENLAALTAGTIPPNPNELLASRAMRELHVQLTANADLVIYDTPAALAVPDALELGHLVDLTILVCRQGVTGRRQLGNAIERMEQTGTSVAGTVLNDIDTDSDGYYYAYYYAQDAAEETEEEAAGTGRGRRSGGKGRNGRRGGKGRGEGGNGKLALRLAGDGKDEQRGKVGGGGAGDVDRGQGRSPSAAKEVGDDTVDRPVNRSVDAWESFFSDGKGDGTGRSSDTVSNPRGNRE